MSRYSNDLRAKVIKAYQTKPSSSKSSIASTFGISRPTLDSWIELDKANKLLETKEYHHGKVSKIDLSKLKKYIDKNPDVYLRELVEIFPLKKSQLSRLINEKLGYTRKKNGMYTKKQTKTNKTGS
jgi:transposase-like protein